VVILRRALSGRSPLAADREHLHHLLLRAGLSYAATTWTLLVAAALSAGVGLAIWKYGVRDSLGFYGFMGVLVATLALTQLMKMRQARIAPPQDQDEVLSVPAAAAAVPARPLVVPREIELREIRKR
jgi:hypothetical protein